MNYELSTIQNGKLTESKHIRCSFYLIKCSREELLLKYLKNLVIKGSKNRKTNFETEIKWSSKGDKTKARHVLAYRISYCKKNYEDAFMVSNGHYALCLYKKIIKSVLRLLQQGISW